MKFLLITTALTGGVFVIIAVIRLARRPHLPSHSSIDQLGPVSEQWLTAHRGERT
jgi:hypothetical protein